MSVDAKRLAQFLSEDQALRTRLRDNPLPIDEHNAWVERMNAYFAEKDADEFAARLSDFSGMTFYGDGSQRSRMSNSIEGRCQRLHEFMAEIQKPRQPIPTEESPVLLLKPNFCGFGIDLRAGWKKVSKWFRQRFSRA